MYQYVPKQTSIPTDSKKAMSAYNLMCKAEKDKLIKLVDFTIPFKNDVTFYDLSISGRGQDEDEIYASDEWYRHNIRRGNTIIQIFGTDGKVLETFYGRKGFEKFFDLTYEYIQYNLGEIKEFTNFGIKKADEHYIMHDIIFKGATEALSHNNKVAAYKLTKANGENAQVSWCSKLNGWLIASKNVGLFATKEADLKQYKEERFAYAKMIAEAWFNTLKKLEKSGKVDELKKELEGKTMIGEYCGNPEFQHLVKYTDIDIIFFAIVENESGITCLSPNDSYKIFQKYGLTCVKVNTIGQFSDLKTLSLALKKVYLDVAESDIDQEEEGSVIYLVKVDSEGKEETLSLSKLKTLEYRIYRKLREKLKNFIAQFSNKKNQRIKEWKEFYDKFVRETRELCTETKPPMPLPYYFKIAKAAFEYADKYPKDTNIIHEQYISFLSVVLYTLDQGKDLAPKCFTDEEINKALKINWNTYFTKAKQEFQEEEKSKENETSSKKGSRTYVIVPIGIPGMGKSFFVDVLTKFFKGTKISFDYLSSDEIRKECMEKLAKTKRNMSRDELFDKTGKDARDLFNERLAKLVRFGDKKDGDAYFIFIDKNHPPSALKGTFATIRENAGVAPVKIIALTPQIPPEAKLSYGGATYPFSKNLLYTCMDRVQKRKDHATLPGSSAKSMGVFVMFFQFFKNVKLNKESILANGFDKFLSVPFSSEDTYMIIPPNLEEKFREALKNTKSGEQCSDFKLIEELNDLYQKSDFQIKNPSPTTLEEAVKNFLNTEIYPEIGSKPAEKVDKKQKPDIDTEEMKSDEIVPKSSGSELQFNPKTIPVYLGIFSLDDGPNPITDYVIKGVESLLTNFDNDKSLKLFLKDLKSGNNPLKVIKDLHVTTLYIGGDKSLINTDYYKNFQENLNMDLKIVGFIFVPGKIITGICYPDQSKIKIQNQFPHLTLMTGSWAPKKSNDLCEALFGQGCPLEKEWTKREFEISKTEFVYKEDEMKFGKEKVTAYIIKTVPDLTLPSITKAWYGQQYII